MCRRCDVVPSQLLISTIWFGFGSIAVLEFSEPRTRISFLNGLADKRELHQFDDLLPSQLMNPINQCVGIRMSFDDDDEMMLDGLRGKNL